MKEVTNAKELGIAIKNRDFPIKVFGRSLMCEVEMIRKPGKIAWAGVLASLGIILLGISPAAIGAGLISMPFLLSCGAVCGSIALAVLGTTTTVAAVNIAYFGGGVSALNTLRARRVTECKNESTGEDEMIIH